jgi:FAD/FMN-containing dehydrogenase
LSERGIEKTRLTILPLLLPFGSGCWDTAIVPFFDQNDKELHSALHEVFLEYLEASRRRGYIIEGSQGHESRLRAMSWTPEFYHYARTLKKVLDPNNIMNPGVYFP